MATIETTPQGADPRAVVTAHPLVVVGGGEHARVVIDAALSRPEAWTVVGYADPVAPAADRGLDTVYLGDDAALARHLAGMRPADRPALVLGFGAPLGNRRATARSFGPDVTWATIVHAAAWVSPHAALEPGCVVLAGAVVNTEARLGAHAIVNSGAVVEHDVVVGAGSHVAPGAVIGGGTRIGEEVLVGLGAAIRDHVTVGDRAVIGMGAVVVGDVADDVTVVGDPARVRAGTDG
jgi:sugar O-acyltransferase (sialic acid O-acetyltransferase NeuD family)